MVGPPVLLYDGTCGLCAWSVRFVLRHDRCRALRFASLQGEFGRSVLERQPGCDRGQTVVWYQPAAGGEAERLLTRSSAVLEVLRYLGGPWRIGLVLGVVPRQVLDAVYRLVARARHRLFGRADACTLAPPADRHRFLP